MFGKTLSALSILGLALAGCNAPQPTAPVIDAETEFESAYFEVSVKGAGPDVILVPGLASSTAVWDGTVEALEGDYTLHLVQVSGFGGAEARGNAGNENVLDDLASDLNRYITTLDGETTLVGHSLGGLVTLKTALSADSQLDRIVIVDVLPFFSVLMDPDATAESIAPVSAVMKATLLAQSEDVFALRQAEALAALVKSDEDLQRALDSSVKSDRQVMAQAMSEVLVTDLRADIARIEIPATIIYANDDAIANMASVEAFYHELYAPLANGTVVPIENGLHFIMLDQPDTFIETLRAALDR